MSSAANIAPSNGGETRGLSAALADWIADWGQFAIDSVVALGEIAIFCWSTISWLFSRPPHWRTLIPCCYQVGVLSLPVVALTGTFIGMVLAANSYFEFEKFNLESRLGALINSTLVRELGPVLAATMLAGRVGSAIAAELGTMRVTEQIDALASMGANPIQYLVVPRLLACLFLIPTLTVMADFMGVVGGFYYSVRFLSIDEHFYWHNAQQYVGLFDLFGGLFKSFFFGAAIAVISCFRGFNCQPGAEGVGKAATGAFVYSFVIILILDLLLIQVLNSVYYSLWPESGGLF